MYITVEELNSLIPSIFLSNELTAVGWDKVSPEDKQVLINRSGVLLGGLNYDINKIDSKFEDSMKKAQVCVIYENLKNLNNNRLELIKQGVKSISTGGVSESYKEEVEEIDSSSYLPFIGRYLFKGVISRI